MLKVVLTEQKLIKLIMDSLEAMQLIPLARTFWNSNDPTLDPFDETLMPTMASPLEAACSSTFLFPSTTDSTCDSGDSQVFKTQLSQQQQGSIIFDEISIPVEEEGAESSRVLITNPPQELYHSTSSWLPAPPAHYHSAQGVSKIPKRRTADDLSRFASVLVPRLLHSVLVTRPVKHVQPTTWSTG